VTTQPYYSDDSVTLYHGDALGVLRELPDGAVDCCVTSPPYFGLRDYGVDGQYGLEASPAEYVETMRAVFAEVRRVLVDDGTLWLNLGDSYVSSNGHTDPNNTSTLRGRRQAGMTPGIVGRRADLPPKSLLGMPWRTALALQDDGWTLRNDVIWSKPNAMPESVTDRLSSRHEHLFMLSKSRTYWFDLDPIREPLLHPDAADGTRVFGGKQGGVGKVGSSFRIAGGMPNTYGRKREASCADTSGLTGSGTTTTVGATPATDVDTSVQTDSGIRGRNPGDVWTVPTQPFAEAHFAVMPQALAERAILAGCKPGGVVLDPFSGSGTSGLAATKHGRRYIGIDLNRDYLDLSLRTRLEQMALPPTGWCS
jgi:DNA modification methylase